MKHKFMVYPGGDQLEGHLCYVADSPSVHILWALGLIASTKPLYAINVIPKEVTHGNRYQEGC